MTTPPRRPEGRYDEPRRLPRQVLVLLAVLLGLLLLTLSYAAFRHAGRTTQATVLGYDVVSDRQLDVRLEVHHARVGEARCVLVAYDRDHRTVGEQSVDLSGAEASPVRLTVHLTTSGRAASAEVTGCAP